MSEEKANETPEADAGGKEAEATTAGPHTAVSLQGVSAEGWYGRLRNGSADYAQAEEVIGEKFLALSLIAGLRVVALAVDRDMPSMSTVGFAMSEGQEVFQASLLEFRRVVVQVLLGADAPYMTLPSQKPSRDELQAYLGVRFILMADVFHVRLRELRFSEGRDPQIAVEVASDELDTPLSKELDLLSFHNLLRDKVRSELEATLAGLIPEFPEQLSREAKAALDAENWDLVIAKVGDWPHKVSSLVRLGEKAKLSDQDGVRVANSLLHLTRSLRRSFRFDEAEEVARTVLQWRPKGPQAGSAYGELASVLLQKGASSQALGIFRRALHMGADASLYLPDLARCYVSSGRFVAAALCCKEAQSAGVESGLLADIQEQIEAKLGAPWAKAAEALAGLDSLAQEALAQEDG